MTTCFRELEDRVVSVIEHNTGGPQPDRIPRHVITIILSSHAGYEADAVWDALDATIADGRLEYDEEAREFWIPEK